MHDHHKQNGEKGEEEQACRFKSETIIIKSGLDQALHMQLLLFYSRRQRRRLVIIIFPCCWTVDNWAKLASKNKRKLQIDTNFALKNCFWYFKFIIEKRICNKEKHEISRIIIIIIIIIIFKEKKKHEQN